MKRKMFSLFIGVVVFLVCASIASASWAPGYIHGTIWGGKSIDLAGFIVQQVNGNLRITINPVSPWKLRDVHIAIVTDPAYFPTNNGGNPKLNEFTVKASMLPTLNPYQIELSLDDLAPGWLPGDSLYIMIHIASEQYNNGDLIADETGWGGPCIAGWNPSMPWPPHFWPFGSARWAYYFEFVLI